MAENRNKKKLVEETLKLKEKSAELQRGIHSESKRLAKVNEQLQQASKELKEAERRQLQLAERGAGKAQAVKEAEEFRERHCAILEVRLAKSRSKLSETEDGNQAIRARIDDSRRMVTTQKDIYAKHQIDMLLLQADMQKDLLHSDSVLCEKDLIEKKIKELVEHNQVEVEDAEQLLTELSTVINDEAKASKEFYERQTKEMPNFDDSFKENMMEDIKNKALEVIDERRESKDIESKLLYYRDAFDRLRREAIGSQSLEKAISNFIAVEEESFKSMSYVRSMEVELEVEEKMLASFQRDIAARQATNTALRKNMEEVESLQNEKELCFAERDRMKARHEHLTDLTRRWVSGLNSVFKTLGMDLERLGVPGGRATLESDLISLMGVLETKGQKILSTYEKLAANGRLIQRSPSTESYTSSLQSSMAARRSIIQNSSTTPASGPAGGSNDPIAASFTSWSPQIGRSSASKADAAAAQKACTSAAPAMGGSTTALLPPTLSELEPVALGILSHELRGPAGHAAVSTMQQVPPLVSLSPAAKTGAGLLPRLSSTSFDNDDEEDDEDDGSFGSSVKPVSSALIKKALSSSARAAALAPTESMTNGTGPARQ